MLLSFDKTTHTTSIIILVNKAWYNSRRHSSFLALTTAIPCSQAFLHVHWRLSKNVQIAAIWLVLNLHRRSHSDDTTPALQKLHWLPINYRIIFKIATMVLTLTFSTIAVRPTSPAYTVRQKIAPFYFCNTFVKPHCILIIYGTQIPQLISNKLFFGCSHPTL